jgi:ABC-2 type transport system permease protein
MTAITIPRLDFKGKVTQVRVIRSEWTKLWTVRSTVWSLFVALVLTTGVPILTSIFISARWSQRSPQDRAHFNPLDHALVGSLIAQLAIGVLGVLVITGEYGTGMIRATLTAVPKRLPVLWAKAIVYGLVVLSLVTPAVLIAFVVGESILARRHIDIAFSHPGVARVVFGAPLYLTVIGLFGLGIGAIIRNTAGAIATFAGVLFVLPPLMNVLPASWNHAASPYLPLNAGQAILSLTRDPEQLGPWTGLGLLALYAAGTLAVAAVLLTRRDT